MKVSDILEHFLSKATWLDRNNTVDRVVIGNPEDNFDRCVVTWMPSYNALKKAVEKGVRLVVCHEPTFYNHSAQQDNPEFWKNESMIVNEKTDFIRKNGIVILRLHDTWDRWPDVGIPWAWARFLGLGDKPAEFGANKYQHRYDISPVELDKFAERVAEKCAERGAGDG